MKKITTFDHSNSSITLEVTEKKKKEGRKNVRKEDGERKDGRKDRKAE